MSSLTVQQSYQHCLNLARQHYENFPVASLLLPKSVRYPVSAIYSFARMADDYADEGNLTAEHRLSSLRQAADKLDQAAIGNPIDDPIYIALADVLQQQPLILQPLHDLLTAFTMDITKQRYQDFGEVMGYCRYSANPVGRMLLILVGKNTERNLAYSDAVCSSLQLINFLQDIDSDLVDRGRIYLPLDEMEKFGISEQQLRHQQQNGALDRFMDFQTQRCLKLLQAGAPLGTQLKGRMGLEIRMIILGGWRVLEKLHHRRGNLTLDTRLQRKDWLWIVSSAVLSRFKLYFKKQLPVSNS